MKRSVTLLLMVTVFLLMLGPGSAFADLYHVSLDLPSLGIGPSVTDLELEIALYDNSDPYDCYVLIDNVVLGTATDDFEDGTLGWFDDFENPGDVYAVAGNLDGTGNHVMRMDATSELFPTIVFRDYYSRDGDVLSLDVEAELEPGDELVFTLLDLDLYPLVDGLMGWGEVAIVDADGLSVVPVPGAFLLAMLGFSTAGMKLRRRLAKHLR